MGSDPVRLTGPVVGLLAAGAGCFVAARRGLGRAAGAVGAAVAVGYAAEWVGVRTGVPFGRYSYT
ncbi:carotenoid biosynthesis protein, partial [Actinomadura sp. KC216]|uniref:carotenoid biosynthesis protein n=1 Tax=Actinomadura sp. KC216 TaxID=2530370 RepID=UPI0024416CAC